MPVTFFAHQTVVLPLKRVRPRWFDGTALVIGSMAPDFGYPMRGWIQRHSHQFAGLVAWGLPFTIVVTLAIRGWVANTAFAHLPDGGNLRLHSYRALRDRRPPWWMMLYSAFIGVGSHILLDSFTHKKAFMARWLGLDKTLFHHPWDSGVSIARTLQFVGHTCGTVLGIAMLLTIGRRRLMEEWYGLETVVAARRFRLKRKQRVLFWVITLSGLALGPAMAAFVRGSVVTKTFLTMAMTTAFASSLEACRPRDRGLTYFDSLAGDPTPGTPMKRPTDTSWDPRRSKPAATPLAFAEPFNLDEPAEHAEPGQTRAPSGPPAPSRRIPRPRSKSAADPPPTGSPPKTPEPPARKSPGWYD
jgi:hypothetical protein